MLLINKEQIEAEEFCEIFDLPIAKMIKAPEFEINKALIQTRKFGQSKELSIPAGVRFHAWFMAKTSKDSKYKGKTVEIRYAEFVDTERVGEKLIDKYEPLKVEYLGESMLVQNMDLDRCIYIYVHPLNEYSPFRGQLVEPFKYSFNDKELKGTAAVQDAMTLGKALRKATQATGAELRVIAKGFGETFTPDAPDVSIQAALIIRAQQNPVDFLKKIDSNQTVVRGLILEGIDNGMFVEKNDSGRHRWIWGKGSKLGVEITEILSSDGKPTSNYLIDHIFSRINSYLPLINETYRTLTSEQAVEEYFENEPKIDLKELLGGGKSKESEFGGSTTEILPKEDLKMEQIKSDQEIVESAKKVPGYEDVTGSTRGKPADVEDVPQIVIEKTVDTKSQIVETGDIPKIDLNLDNPIEEEEDEEIDPDLPPFLQKKKIDKKK